MPNLDETISSAVDDVLESDSGGNDSEAGDTGTQEAGESEGGGGATQAADQAPSQSASAAPAMPARVQQQQQFRQSDYIDRNQLDGMLRQRDNFWKQQLDRINKVVNARVPQKPKEQPPEQILPTMKEWIEKGYDPAGLEYLEKVVNANNSKYSQLEEKYNGLHSQLRGDFEAHQRQLQQRETETQLNESWKRATDDVFTEFKHIQRSPELESLIENVLFTEGYRAMSARKDPRFMDSRSVVRSVMKIVDKLVKDGIKKSVSSAPAPATPPMKGAPTKGSERKQSPKTEKEFFKTMEARTRAILDGD